MTTALRNKKSRTQLLAILVGVAMVVFVGRLFYLQVIQHGHYTKLAMSEQVKRLAIPAKRGMIYAMDGTSPVPLVMNEKVYTVFADPQTTTDDSKIVEVIRRVAGGSARTNLADLLALKKTRYQILATKLSRTQADMIKAEGLHGVGFQEGTQRVYPEGMLAAQVLGFVDAAGDGKYGVEGALDARLKGRDGLLQSVTDVSAVPLTIGNNNISTPAVDGDNIVLTVDRNIQSYAQEALARGFERTGATHGSVLVMNPNTGAVLSMVNLPTYHPGDFTKVTDAALFNNNIISVPFEPGSNVKAFTMATGIEKGVVGPQSTYTNTDTIRVEDRTIRNATKGHTGVITMQTALEWSLNTGFVTIAQRLGNGSQITREARDTMYDYLHNRFRLGERTGIELSGEARGLIVAPTEVEGNAVRYSNMSFGQGMESTILQVGAAFSSLVNGGRYYKPTVVSGVMSPTGQFTSELAPEPILRPVQESTSQTVRGMLSEARHKFFGSVDKAGYEIGGKTGTSEVIVDGRYSETQTTATYIGYGGGERPEYVIMVQLSGKDKLLQGARDALPVFTDVSNWLIDYLRILPKG